MALLDKVFLDGFDEPIIDFSKTPEENIKKYDDEYRKFYEKETPKMTKEELAALELYDEDGNLL